MKVEKETITTVAYIFAYFLSVLLLKYILYDNGFFFSNILLLIGLIYTRFHLFKIEWTKTTEGVQSIESSRLAEAACLIIFVLFDKSLLDVGNIFLLLGVACLREQFQDKEMLKEVSSLICGLIYLLMGWFSVGRILVIYFLLEFYFYTVVFIGLTATIVIFKTIFESVIDDIAKKFGGKKDVKSDAVDNKNELKQS